MVNILCSIIDIFIVSPLFLIAFITHPVSTFQSFNEFKIDWDPKQEQPQQQEDAQNANQQNQQNQNNGNFSDQWQKLIRYNIQIRTQFFFLAVFGLFGMPCTHYISYNDSFYIL